MNIIGIDFSILYPGICISKDFKEFKWIGIANNKITKKDTRLMEDLALTYPNLKLHALGPPEIAHITKLEKSTHTEVLKALLENPKPYAGNFIKEAKTAQDELSKKVLERITDEKEKAITAIQNAIEDIKTKEEFVKLDAGNQNKIILPFKEEINKLQAQRYIAVIRDVKSKTFEYLLPKQLNEMIRLSTPTETVSGEVSEPTPHYIRRTSIKIDFKKTELRTEADVNEYVEALKKALIEQIKETRRISL